MASPLSLGSASPLHYPVRIGDGNKPVKEERDDSKVKDRHNLVYWNFFYQGLSSHFPWNVLLVGHAFFSAKLKDLGIARDFLAHFTIIFMLVKYIFMLSAMFFLRRYRPKWQVIGSISGAILTFLALTLICTLQRVDLHFFYICTLVLVLFASIFSAVLEAGIFAIVGQFPVQITQAYSAGHGLAGVVVISINVSAYFYVGTFKTAEFAAFYFGVSSMLIVVSLGLFLLMQQNAFYQHYHGHVEDVVDEHIREADQALHRVRNCANTMDIFAKIKDIAIAILISSTVSFTIFPEFTFATKSIYCGTPDETWFHRDMFIPLALFLANVFDFGAKLIPMVPALAFQNGPYVLLACCRGLLIPLKLLGNLKFKGYKLAFAPLLASDILFYTWVSLASLTSSFLFTVAIMWVPLRVERSERIVAMALLMFCAAIGFMTGSLLAISIKHVLLAYATPIPTP